jgi:hypothetical protein
MRARGRVSRVGGVLAGVLGAAGCSGGASESSVATPASEEAPASAPGDTPVAPESVSSKQGLADAPADDAAASPPRPPVPRAPGEGERLNPEIAGLGTEVMLAAFPERVGAWVRESANAHPAGTAGRWADGASAVYRDGEREVRVDVTDMIRVNACTPGTSEAMRKASLDAEPKSEIVAVNKWPAVLVPGSAGAELGLWLGNRCQLGLSSAEATGDELVALGWGLGLGGLVDACGRRDPVGVLGR